MLKVFRVALTVGLVAATVFEGSAEALSDDEPPDEGEPAEKN